jgi:signal transduction histidine kinase
MSGALSSPARSDVVLAAVMTTLCVVELFADYAFEHTTTSGPGPVHLLVAVLVGGSVAWRRVHPMLVAPFVCVALALQALVVQRPNVYGEILVVLLVLFGLTAYASSWRSAASAIVIALGFAALLGVTDTEDPVGESITLVIFASVVLLSGSVVRRQRDKAEEMTRQRDRADARAREITTTERARIARELHDVVAHGMSVVILQARGGRRMLTHHPGRASVAFDDIERVASDCLDEMRRLLGILRAPEQDALPALAPQPKLRELASLIDRARASGADVELVVDGEPRDLAPAVELSAYRIAQEALTNSLQHAPGSTARVSIGYEPDAVAIAVTDNGPGTIPGASGHGLIGMRERVELFGGTFSAGPEVGGGFGVHARLPLTGASS